MELLDKSTKILWKKALKYIVDNGENYVDGNHRLCREVLNLSLTINSFKDIDDPIYNLAGMEKWIYPRPSEIKSIIFGNTISKSSPYSYGSRIFSYITEDKIINQIDDFIIPALQSNKYTRKAVITLLNPIKDKKTDSNQIPALVSLDFKIRNGKLNIFAHIRSNDIFIGWPANVYQIYLLGKYISEKLFLDVGSITTYSTSAHIFLEYKDDIKKLIGN